MLSDYWTEEEIQLSEKASEYHHLFPIVHRVLLRMDSPRVQMCGPITTGGAGSIEANLTRFEKAHKFLEGLGKQVFSQLPIEDAIQKIIAVKNPDTYPQELLDELYLPIFESGLIDEMHFLPDWETSTGSCWEHTQGTRLGINIFYISPESIGE